LQEIKDALEVEETQTEDQNSEEKKRTSSNSNSNNEVLYIHMTKGNSQIDDVIERIQYFGCSSLRAAVNG